VRSTPPVTGLPDEEFIAGVRRIAGYQHPALDDPELRELLLPVLRADVAAHESYSPAWAAPLACRLTAIRGTQDALVSRDSCAGWRAATSGQFRMEEIPGRHMYLSDSHRELVSLMEQVMHA
jgi:surfactin synthase thioesterase subunit